jgi:hypothetical protein
VKESIMSRQFLIPAVSVAVLACMGCGQSANDSNSIASAVEKPPAKEGALLESGTPVNKSSGEVKNEKALPEKLKNESASVENPTAENVPPSAAAIGNDEASNAAIEQEFEREGDLIDGISNPILIGVFTISRQEAKDNPKDARRQLAYVESLQAVAREWVREGDLETAYSAFGAAGAAARRFLATKVPVPDMADKLLANVFYNEACVRCRNGDVTSALSSLDDAFRWGFSDLKLLESDEDLAQVRASPEFEQRLKQWTKATRDKMPP